MYIVAFSYSASRSRHHKRQAVPIYSLVDMRTGRSIAVYSVIPARVSGVWTGQMGNRRARNPGFRYRGGRKDRDSPRGRPQGGAGKPRARMTQQRIRRAKGYTALNKAGAPIIVDSYAALTAMVCFHRFERTAWHPCERIEGLYKSTSTVIPNSLKNACPELQISCRTVPA